MLPYKQEVAGSSPALPTILCSKHACLEHVAVSANVRDSLLGRRSYATARLSLMEHRQLTWIFVNDSIVLMRLFSSESSKTLFSGKRPEKHRQRQS